MCFSGLGCLTGKHKGRAGGEMNSAPILARHRRQRGEQVEEDYTLLNLAHVRPTHPKPQGEVMMNNVALKLFKGTVNTLQAPTK